MKQHGTSNIRLCPVCQTGYIMSSDLLPRCESCLGPEHAGLALTPGATCTFCKLLTAHERRRRADAYADMDDPPLVLEASDGDFDSPPAHTPLTAIGVLMREMPGLIQKAAASKQLTVPTPQTAAPPDEMVGVYPSSRRARDGVSWPRFPGICKYQDSAREEPGKMKAPVLTYVPITRVAGFSDRGFPPVPTLEPGLASVFGGAHAPLPSESDGDEAGGPLAGITR
ncbi:unnamed protein product [Pleuronectes platessa]|uniref:Uncharacterized protein n=1 Tax=Pleuronectes platessa TaxID=8262 RepID=A0A9N7YHA2_PLEPL|nr:unnamed protein product [Pleuronectes platessa]